MKIEEYRKILIKRNTTHGEHGTPLYGTWHGITNRCKNKNADDYSRYGGRGIRVEWQSYEEFSKDMKKSFLLHVEKYGVSETTIERKDVNGNYSKGNCVWATRKEQAQNRRTNRKYTYDGKTQTIAMWAEDYGMHRQSLRYRLNAGLGIKEALNLPIKHSNRYA